MGQMGSHGWMAIGMIAGAGVGVLLGAEGMIVALVAGAVIGHLVDRARNDDGG